MKFIFKIFFIFVVGLFHLQNANAVDFEVTSNNDNTDLNNVCGLREAIENANNNTATHPGCPAGSATEVDRIILNTSGPIALDVASGGQLEITDSLELVGEGVTIQSGGFNRVFHINNAGSVEMSHLIIENGAGVDDGAGILIEGTTVSLTNISLATNIANVKGGGLSIQNLSTVSLENVTISGNTAGSFGGGVDVDSSILTINNSNISSNSAPSTGGGLRLVDSLVEITNSLISDNEVTRLGAGLRLQNSSLELTNVTVSGNRVDNGSATTFIGGAGLSENNSSSGHIVKINFSTIAANTITYSGSGSPDLRGAGIHRANTRGSFTIKSTIIAGNELNDASGGANLQGEVCSGTLTSGDFNFLYDRDSSHCSFSALSNDLEANTGTVILALIFDNNLGENGGLTSTHALGSINPNFLNNQSDCLDIDGDSVSFDQRGAVRGFQCTIGAFEHEGTESDQIDSVTCRDEIDNDGNGLTDCEEDDANCDCEELFIDADGDGERGSSTPEDLHHTFLGNGYTDNTSVEDCDDSDATINSSAQEICGDGIDWDCDGNDSNGFDVDGDGTPDCIDDDSDGFSEDDGDCDDLDPLVNPSATELCGDEIDNNCNDELDEGFDADGDGTLDCVDDDRDGL